MISVSDLDKVMKLSRHNSFTAALAASRIPYSQTDGHFANQAFRGSCGFHPT
jgi:hypothetical protein